MAKAPKRVKQHETDSIACKCVENSFSSKWELRELTGIDYGIDRIAERFEDEYATGEMILLQIKGTEKDIDPQNVKFLFPVKTLIYSQLFAIPFLFVYCNINKPGVCYYIWLQEYIDVRLKHEKPTWKQQDKITLYFDSENILMNSENALSTIAKFPKLKDYYIGCVIEMDIIPIALNEVVSFMNYLAEAFDITLAYKETINGMRDTLKRVKLHLENTKKYHALLSLYGYDKDIDQTVSLINNIIKNSEYDYDKYNELIRKLSHIDTLIAVMGNLFSSDYKRILYEFDESSMF